MNSISSQQIERSILLIRGQRVMLDNDLARLYDVTTKRLNEQVKRNLDRFPEDFMFQLNEEEGELLRSHFATSKEGRGGRRYLPYVFTEHGTVMLASILNSPVAVKASIQVVRAFIQLRQIVSTHEELLRKVNILERKYDSQFQAVFDAIKSLMIQPDLPRRKIGI
jgi:hypothetical protein